MSDVRELPSRTELLARLGSLTLRDEHRLRRRIDGLRRMRDQGDRTAAWAAVVASVEVAEQRAAARRERVPRLRFPPQLPVSARREDIAAAIRDHQVVVVAGETGSGKTTQLPKICLGLGRGVRGMIGHTQPRRLAARAVAERIAAECGVPLGEAIGYQVRFGGSASDATLVKVMTDGILLAELAHDPDLRRYDTLIVDEAHERSLNIDFILGYLARVLPRRPDLKVVITSATIDPQRFADHFAGAPVVEVSGRTYPVELRYRPFGPAAASEVVGPADDRSDDRDEVSAVCDAVAELAAAGPGDVLVFLSGEREIRDTADALHDRVAGDTQILPLFARLTSAEQHRVFAPLPPGVRRRVVLATNVAETSLTVPGVRFVVDAGNARISRYSRRLKVQRLPIEPVSRASAEQRAGRCGREGPGVCIRLYPEADYLARPRFTDPEILRTHLASVVLQMAALRLGDVVDFPFLDPPDRRDVADGVRLLVELGALTPGPGDVAGRLTDSGRRLARLPLDPRLGRMVLAAERNGCVHEVLVISAGLTIQDPRERPADDRAAADASHARFADPGSDFLALLNLWRYLAAQQADLSGSAFRRLCRREYLHYLRVREWQDLYGQLRSTVRELGIPVSRQPEPPADEPDDADSAGRTIPGKAALDAQAAIHRSLLAGLLSQLGLKDPQTRDYQGARGSRFRLAPSSALAGTPPRWVMVAELVETNRLWGRVAARIDPAWVEPLADHLVVRTYHEPRWDAARGAAVADESVLLFGLPLVTRRTVGYARVDPAVARELFIRHALVEGDWAGRHAFLAANRAAVAAVEEMEDRSRRKDLLADDDTLVGFFDQRLPADVVSARHFDAWWRRVRSEQPDLLSYPAEVLRRPEAGAVPAADFPDSWPVGPSVLPLTYSFDPGSDDDGVTVDIPLALFVDARAVAALGLDWHVPGMRVEVAAALLRGLPKQVRRRLVPVPDTARGLVAALPRQPQGELTAALGRELLRRRAVVVPPALWPHDLPDHLRVRARVLDDNGRPLDADRDLTDLRHRLAGRLRRAVARAGREIEQDGLRSWTLDTLPREVSTTQDGHVVTGYPALVDERDSVAVRVLPSRWEQQRSMAAGTRRLLMTTIPSPVRAVVSDLPRQDRLALAASAYPSVPALLEDCVACAVDAIVVAAGGPAWDRAGFDALSRRVADQLGVLTRRIVAVVADTLSRLTEVRSRLADEEAHPPAADDVRRQVAAMLANGFVSRTGWPQLAHLPRYLTAAADRLDRARQNPVRDDRLADVVADVEKMYADRLAELGPERRDSSDSRRLWWLIEELRVSLFAQHLGTAQPVSDQRLRRALAELS